MAIFTRWGSAVPTMRSADRMPGRAPVLRVPLTTTGPLPAAGAPRWLATAMLVGGTAGGAMMLLLTGGQSTGATTDSELLTPDTATVFWRLAHGVFLAAELALAVFLGALGILALRGVLLPRWLGWFGLAVAIVLLIPPIGWAALLFLLPLWLIVASVVLWRRPASAPSVP